MFANTLLVSKVATTAREHSLPKGEPPLDTPLPPQI